MVVLENIIYKCTPIGIGENFSFFICRRPPDEIRSYKLGILAGLFMVLVFLYENSIIFGLTVLSYVYFKIHRTNLSCKNSFEPRLQIDIEVETKMAVANFTTGYIVPLSYIANKILIRKRILQSENLIFSQLSV